jgi:hypothetical protein
MNTHRLRLAGVAVVCTALLALSGYAAGVAPHPDWKNAMAPKGQRGPWLTLAVAGKTEYTLLVPQRPTGPEQKAAEDLAQWLGAITGATFPVLPEDGTPRADGAYISIGATALRAAGKVPPPKLDLGDDGYAIQAAGQALFISGGKRRGLPNAVYSLLQEDLGCRWYLPGTDPVIPKQATLRFRPVLRAYRPVFEDRRDPYYGDVAYDADWSLRNRTYALTAQVPAAAGGYPRFWPSFVHTYDALIPPATYFKDHPEYYSEIAGKRQPFQLCTTNPDVRRLIVDQVVAALRAKPDTRIVDVSPNDRRDYCDCARCKAIDDAEGTRMGSLLTLINLVADAVLAEFPEVRITTLAYLDTVVPPATIRPRANVLFWLCTDAHAWSQPNLFVWETEKFSSSMKRWQEIGAKLVIWDYPSDFAYMQPNLNLPVVSENVRWYAEHGATGIFYQCMHSWNRAADHSYLRGWLWAQQAWNPQLDTRALVRDFNYGFYGKAAEPMQAYDEMLWRAWKEWRRHRREKDYKGPVDAEFAARGLARLTQATALAAGDAELARRIDIARLPLLFVTLQAGRQGEVTAYLKLADEFERIAKAANVTFVENAFQAPDLDAKLTYWREKARLDPAKLSCQPLSNQWRFKPDATDAGVSGQWYAADLDDSGWAQVRSDTGTGWEAQGFAGHHGYGWYRQRFTVTDAVLAQETLRLFLGAVDEQAWVYLNGRPAFEHTVGSTGLPVETLWTTPFGFDPKPFLKPGDNTIVVRVHDTLGMAGIWKPVTLIWGELNYSPQLLEEMIRLKGATQ